MTPAPETGAEFALTSTRILAGRSCAWRSGIRLKIANAARYCTECKVASRAIGKLSSMPANLAIAPNPGELAGHRGVRECLQWFTREKQWINEIHLQLCRIPAPTFL